MSGTQGVLSIKALLMALLLFACSVTLYMNVSDIRISRGQTLNSRFRNIFSSMRRHVPSPGQKLEQIPRNVEASWEISPSSASASRIAGGIFAEAIRHIPEKVHDLGKMLKTAEEEFIQRELKSKGQTSLIGLPAPTVKAASKDQDSKGQSATASNPEPIDKVETAEAGNASDDDIDGEARKGNEQQGNQQKVNSQQVQSDMKKNVKDMYEKGGVEDGDSKWEPSNRRVDGRRGDSSHLCKGVTGSEDGEWVDIGDGTMQYMMVRF